MTNSLTDYATAKETKGEIDKLMQIKIRREAKDLKSKLRNLEAKVIVKRYQEKERKTKYEKGTTEPREEAAN